MSFTSPITPPTSVPHAGSFAHQKLNFCILRAENLYNPSWGKEGSQDPWCKVTIGDRHISTAVINNTPSPQWNYSDTFDLKGTEKENIVHIEVFHKALLTSSLIGHAEIPLQELLSKQGPTWFRLSKHKKGKDHANDANGSNVDDLYAGDILIQCGSGDLSQPALLGQQQSMVSQQQFAGQQQQQQQKNLDVLQQPVLGSVPVSSGIAVSSSAPLSSSESLSKSSVNTGSIQQQQQAPMATVNAFPQSFDHFRAESLGEPKVYYGECSLYDKGGSTSLGTSSVGYMSPTNKLSGSSEVYSKQATQASFVSGVEGQQSMMGTQRPAASGCTGCEKNL